MKQSLHNLCLQVSSERKKIASTIGMKRSMETSELLRHRIKNVVPERTDKMQQAIIEKDFKTFAELTMKDSNQFHAVCLDTYPPCTYMNDISHAITNLLHSYNDAMDDIKVYNVISTILILIHLLSVIPRFHLFLLFCFMQNLYAFCLNSIVYSLYFFY